MFQPYSLLNKIYTVSFETTFYITFSNGLCTNNATWCQNRGCSYISSRRRIYRSNPAVSCISPSILNISTVELQFYYSKKGGRQRSVQSAIGSRVFRAVLPSRIFILSGRKALQAPPAVPHATKHSTQQKLHSMWPEVTSSSLWCSRVAVEEEF